MHLAPPIFWAAKALYLTRRGEFRKHRKAMASFAIESLVYTICIVAVLYKYLYRVGYQLPYIEVCLPFLYLLCLSVTQGVLLSFGSIGVLEVRPFVLV